MVSPNKILLLWISRHAFGEDDIRRRPQSGQKLQNATSGLARSASIFWCRVEGLIKLQGLGYACKKGRRFRFRLHRDCRLRRQARGFHA